MKPRNPRNDKLKIGTYLLRRGYISEEQIKEIMKEQGYMQIPNVTRFGRLAVNKGYIEHLMLEKLMMEKYEEETNQ